MAEITECTAEDWDEFWQDTPQDATGATETGEQAEKAYAPVWWLRTGTEKELRAYLAADENEQEDK